MTGRILLAALVMLAVLGYNYWSWCCGHCTAATFLTLGPFGRILLSLVLFAALTLVALRAQRLARLARARCCCGALLAKGWQFCPHCGLGR